MTSPELSAETLPAIRAAVRAGNLTPAEAIGDRDIAWSDHRLGDGVVVTVLRPRQPRPGAPGLYSIHGGGMVMDDRFADLPRLVALIEEFGFVAATVEYRLAPEHPHPAPLEDCYAGLRWFAETFRFDRLVVGGGSAGGGLAAGVALLARDRGGPALAGQLLLCPMLDDRTAHEVPDAVWTRAANDFGWRSLLAGQTSPYAAPARMADLTRLPPAFVEVGGAELFRDEDVAYAQRLARAGVPTELHVWADAHHGFDRFAPDTEVTRAALAARSSWLRRLLSGRG
ncbi:alpha/beta hydrolase [Amycolatopsis australiensis]|uniref:Acetyl esterase/lipase n=1 Tax=Amycolatopsis australiensis TaxID=546364 RepID=A0A1K1SGA8_9PSEU|nr:alpha/beta hydrolase fold domain-containing protein [Amycolatopsis australiensis]SFW83334.1 Acetyl esterase/lipase [Amycolatopsis australiensis]